MDILTQLKRPFPVNQLKWRKGGGGKELVYINAQQYQQRLDEVMGVNWQCEYTQVTHTGLTACKVGLMLPCLWDDPEQKKPIEWGWVWRSSGAGETNIEGDKGTFTDSFKRACSAWGIGRYLYAGFDKNNIPSWATPSGYLELIEKRKNEAA